MQQVQRARVMADACLTYFQEHYTTTIIADVLWVGRKITYNPSDVLVTFENGTVCGVSCKSSRHREALTFKNMGVTHFNTHLNLELKPIYEHAARAFCVQHMAPFKSNERKLFIRANTELQEISSALAANTLAYITGLITNALVTRPEEWLRDYFLRCWMDYYTSTRWIRVTGTGTKRPYTARVEDPTQLEGPYRSLDYVRMRHGQLRINPLTNTSIGIFATLDETIEAPVFKIRAKYESEPLASSLKFLGEPV